MPVANSSSDDNTIEAAIKTRRSPDEVAETLAPCLMVARRWQRKWSAIFCTKTVKVERHHLHKSESAAPSSAQEKETFVEPEICTKLTRKRGRRGRHFDSAVERLVAYLAEARQAGQNSEDAMINYLNERGVPPPTGKSWTAGTMHRVLVRERELKLGPGPRSSYDAAVARPSRAGQGERRKRAPYASSKRHSTFAELSGAQDVLA
jgi:hypothetical protein